MKLTFCIRRWLGTMMSVSIHTKLSYGSFFYAAIGEFFVTARIYGTCSRFFSVYAYKFGGSHSGMFFEYL